LISPAANVSAEAYASLLTAAVSCAGFGRCARVGWCPVL